MKMAVHSRKSSAESVISYLNVENAKLVAFVLVIGFIGYHGVMHLRYGHDSCIWLLSSGRYKGDHEWQPYGCMMHKYSKTDASRCLRYLAFWGNYNSFAFIGDIRLRYLYNHFIDVIKTNFEEDKTYSIMDQHIQNYTYVHTKLHLSVKFIRSDDVSSTMVETFRTWKDSSRPPSVIIASTGLSLLLRNKGSPTSLEEYKRNLTQLVQPIDVLAKRGTQVLWKLMEPVDMNKLQFQNKVITNAAIDAYNKAAVEILAHSATRFFESPRLISSQSLSEDGMTPNTLALRHCSQIILNMYCNDHMNYNDGSCCAEPESYTVLQMATFAIFVVCAVPAIIKATWRFWQKLQNRFRGYSLVNQPVSPIDSFSQSDQPSIFTALAKLGMIMGYFYLCDRTNFFMKENKYYSEWSFWLPVGYVFALGLFFTEDSRYSRVLHRDQTNEWKGWMQAVILIYQVTGASKVLPIYMLIRVVVSAYIMLNGFGHFVYIWNTGDTSLVRYFRVMFRLNFLTAVLCLTMNRPYQFYSFVPLISFWYTFTLAIFSLPPHVLPASAHTPESKPYQYLYIAIKIIGLLTIVTVLYMSEVFFQKIFVTRPWKALFVNSDDDIHEWWMLWKQDRYSTTFGIIFAMGYVLAQRYNILDNNNHSNLFTPGISLSVTLLAFIGLGSYITFTFFCDNTYDCNEIHSYIAFVPIVSYVILRNVSGAMRTRHSTLFAWLGTFTLEIFVSQSHIWLAADTHGVLVLIPGAPGLNLIVTSYIFICAAHELHKLTQIIQPYAVPDDWKLVLRNFGVFLVVLVLIGVHVGMF